MEDNLCKRGSVISRTSSVGVSSRIFYYYHHRGLDGGVPFKWEMQPGTPINPQPEEIVPPLTPPPALLSRSLTKPSFGESNKHSLFPANLKLWKWKNLRNRYFSKWSSQSMLSRDTHENQSSESEREKVDLPLSLAYGRRVSERAVAGALRSSDRDNPPASLSPSLHGRLVGALVQSQSAVDNSGSEPSSLVALRLE
ncbi:hypothetical protein Bca52824_051624 [Brassica carinata]|nr:hypothetical protein Bca52824_051624 [Brassica carinata]